MKKINTKLTVDEIQALAIAAAYMWINKPEQINPLEPKRWKKLSEYLFAIYRINCK